MSAPPPRGRGRPRLIYLEDLVTILRARQSRLSWNEVGRVANVDPTTACKARTHALSGELPPPRSDQPEYVARLRETVRDLLRGTDPDAPVTLEKPLTTPEVGKAQESC